MTAAGERLHLHSRHCTVVSEVIILRASVVVDQGVDLIGFILDLPSDTRRRRPVDAHLGLSDVVGGGHGLDDCPDLINDARRRLGNAVLKRLPTPGASRDPGRVRGDPRSRSAALLQELKPDAWVVSAEPRGRLGAAASKVLGLPDQGARRMAPTPRTRSGGH